MRVVAASNRVLNSWENFAVGTVGELLPINFIEQDEHVFIVGHSVEDHETPLRCKGGQVVRRLALTFELSGKTVSWS